MIPCLVNKRAAKPGKLEQKFTEGNGGRKECLLVQDTKEALEYLLSGKKDEDIIYAAGSLYLVGEIKALLRRRSCD